MWRSLDHKFVLPFLGVYENNGSSQCFLASPYMKNGTLAQWRKKVVPSPLEVDTRVRLILFLQFLYLILTCFLRKLLEVAQGIHYIHSEGVVHGDLHGVLRLNHSIANHRYANLSNRPTSSWMTNFMLKSPILD